MTESCRPTFDTKHDHPHIHDKNNVHRPREQKRLIIALVITTVMMVIELIGGILTNSLALISDAAHMLSHGITLLVSLIAIRLAMRQPTPEKSFGYYRAEVLAALFNAVTLGLISFYIFYEGYQRFLDPQPIAEVQMFWIALAGLFVNLLTVLVLRDVSHDDINVKSVFMHLMGDTLSSVGIVIAAVVIYFTGWYVLDALVSIGVASLILYWSYKLTRASAHILLEASPKHLSMEKIKTDIKALCPEVKAVHDIHVWEITSKLYAMTAHLNVANMTVKETQSITHKLNVFLDETYHITHTNFQFESEE